MSNRILLTGATGFVGMQVMKYLSTSDNKLWVVAREKKLNKIENNPSVEKIIKTKNLFEHDQNWWAEQCFGVDAIIHIAWYAEPNLYLQAEQNIDCLIGSINLAKGAIAAGVKKFIGIGTCFEYDLSYRLLSVDTPLKPSTLYAATKASLYLNLSQIFELSGINFSWCRLFYLYGKNEDPRRLASYIRKQIEKKEPIELTSGNQVRDFLDVEEAARKIVQIYTNERTGAVNICSGKPITVREFAESIADEYGSRNLLRFGARKENLIDPPYIVGVI
jgi:dTDP-6-deoxy-L-talose 4-dehydrogenase (NAD+)